MFFESPTLNLKRGSLSSQNHSDCAVHVAPVSPKTISYTHSGIMDISPFNYLSTPKGIQIKSGWRPVALISSSFLISIFISISPLNYLIIAGSPKGVQSSRCLRASVSLFSLALSSYLSPLDYAVDAIWNIGLFTTFNAIFSTTSSGTSPMMSIGVYGGCGVADIVGMSISPQMSGLFGSSMVSFILPRFFS